MEAKTATTSLEPRARPRVLRTLLARETAVGWSLVSLGVVLRLARFLHDRSLWGDEARLALNIRDKSFTGLVHPLDYVQAAPQGFLLAEKVAVDLFGDGERALRLVPLLAGCASLALFFPLARRFLRPQAALAAVGLYALVDPLVYYSSEAKQYSLDALATVLLVFVAAPAFTQGELRARRAVALLATGAATFWFSHPSVFVATGIWLAVVLTRTRLPGGRVVAPAVSAAVWLASFGAAYALVVRNAKGVSHALGLGESGAGVTPEDVLRDGWHAFAYPAGFAYTTTALAATLALVGCVGLWRRRPRVLAPLVLTTLAAVGAAMIQRYPFTDRFLIFLVPIVLLVVAAGFDEFLQAPTPGIRAASAVVLVLILAYPAGIAAKRLVSPPGHEEIKPVLAHVADAWRAGDSLYVSTVAQYPLRYYAECEDCGVLDGTARSPLRSLVLSARGGTTALHSEGRQLIVGHVDWGTTLPTYISDFRQLDGRRRAWFLFTSTWDDAQTRLVLGCMGRRLDAVADTRAAAYLYDLAASPDNGPGQCPGASVR